MIRVGIDTSTTNTAVVVMDEDGLLEYFLISPKDKDITVRSKFITQEIEKFIDRIRSTYNTEDVIIGIEGASFMSVGKRDKLVMLMGHVYYSVLNYNFSCHLLPPSTIKKQFTGNGRAKKEEMISNLPLYVKKLFEKDYKKIDDLADAYAICTCL